MYKTLLTDLSDNIFTITINRPDKLNAINNDVMDELSEVVDEIYSNKDIRSAIITGAGQRAFVAGADIAELQGLTKEEGQALAAKGQGVFMRIASSPKPIAAAIHGFALGGGCELAMACHFRLCSQDAKFGQPEVNLGLIPGYGGTQRLTQLVGRGRAIEIMLSARLVGATEAHVMGLVNYIVEEPNELLTKTRELLSIINEKAPMAVARIIECANIAAGDGGGAGNGANDDDNWEADPFGGGVTRSHSSEATDAHGNVRHAGHGGVGDGGGRPERGGGTSAGGRPEHGGGVSDGGGRAEHGGTISIGGGILGSAMLNGFTREQEAFGECFGTEDMKEGTKAFLQKRKPKFTGH